MAEQKGLPMNMSRSGRAKTHISSSRERTIFAPAELRPSESERAKQVMCLLKSITSHAIVYLYQATVLNQALCKMS